MFYTRPKHGILANQSARKDYTEPENISILSLSPPNIVIHIFIFLSNLIKIPTFIRYQLLTQSSKIILMISTPIYFSYFQRISWNTYLSMWHLIILAFFLSQNSNRPSAHIEASNKRTVLYQANKGTRILFKNFGLETVLFNIVLNDLSTEQ